MKYSIFISILILIFSFYSCSKPVNDLYKDSLHGSVKKVTEIAFEGDLQLSTDSAANEFSSIVTLYDKHGFQIEKSYFDKGKMVQKVIPLRSHYVLIGNYRLNGDGEPMLSSTIKKVSDTEYEEIVVNLKGKLFSKEKLIFENNRKISGTIYYQTIEYTTNYLFDQNGLLLSTSQKNNTGEEEYNYNYKYLEFDKLNNWTRRQDYSSQGAKDLKFTIIRKYEYYR